MRVRDIRKRGLGYSKKFENFAPVVRGLHLRGGEGRESALLVSSEN